ncbi:MAG: porin [Anaerolineales bacterium]|nr:porin [Anaerolineales bacterium]
MKKKLLLATALASTLGAAGIAEAASGSFSGHTRVGVTADNPDSSNADTYAGDQKSNFAVSISETTDAGVAISTGFTLADEGTAEVDSSGLTLTFTDGSSLQLIEAGSAAAAHAVTVPGGGGELGITNTSSNNAAGGLTTGMGSDAVGFDYATAADAFGVEGLSANVSASFNSDVSATSGAAGTVTLENSYAVGVTYVTTAGDSTVTVGAGYNQGDVNSDTATKDNQTFQLGGTVVTGDLTVGAGYMDGDWLADNEQMSGSFVSAGAKYVSGDITFNIGMSSGDASDESIGVSGTSVEDSVDKVGASVDYVIASGVTGTVGYRSEDVNDEGTSQTAFSGSTWYVGATVSF